MLPGMGSAFSGSAAAVKEAAGVSVVASGTNLTVNNDTFSAGTVSFGAEPTGGATRHMLVVVSYGDNDDGNLPLSGACTLGGVSVTEVDHRARGTAETDMAGYWVGLVSMPTGTSGALSFVLSNFDGTMDAFSYGVLRVINLDSTTPTSTVTNDGTGAAISLTVPSSGFGVLVGVDCPGSPGAWSGTGATTIYSGQVSGAASYRTNAGSVSHDSTGMEIGSGYAWAFD
jgi:hypothetical protein